MTIGFATWAGVKRLDKDVQFDEVEFPVEFPYVEVAFPVVVFPVVVFPVVALRNLSCSTLSGIDLLLLWLPGDPSA